MANVKVKVLDAVVDGHKKGEVIEVDAKSADALVANGYVKLVEAEKKSEAKGEAKKDDKK